MYVNAAASSSIYSANSNPTAAQIQSTDNAFAAFLNDSDSSAEDMLKEITQDGLNSYMKWQVKKLKEKITDQVMASKNLTPDKIAAMPAKQRVAVEQQIMREVAEKLKQAIAQQMKKQNHNQLGLDVMDSSPSLASSDAASVNMLA